jgi:hypothetical protein
MAGTDEYQLDSEEVGRIVREDETYTTWSDRFHWAVEQIEGVREWSFEDLKCRARALDLQERLEILIWCVIVTLTIVTFWILISKRVARKRTALKAKKA